MGYQKWSEIEHKRPMWRLSCGHQIPRLAHDSAEDPPRRPRMCPVCQKMRKVEGNDENAPPPPEGESGARIQS